MKEESEKVDLKLNIQKIKIMASGPITSKRKQSVGKDANKRELLDTIVGM